MSRCRLSHGPYVVGMEHTVVGGFTCGCLCGFTLQRFANVQIGLDALNIPFVVDDRLVRGLVRCYSTCLSACD